MSLPPILSGLRVVEFSAFVAAPLSGLTLAQMGADVVRVDPLGGNIDANRWPLNAEGRSLYWGSLNRGKRSVASSFYDTQDIAYSRAPGTRAYYQFNRWTDRPQSAIHAQLASRLEAGGAKGALRLNTHLEEIYHDAPVEPGTARITIAAELVDASRSVLARRTFTRSAPAASYDTPGAVLGFNQALALLIGDIEAWVAAESQRPR